RISEVEMKSGLVLVIDSLPLGGARACVF
ncbi:MAG: hypothetical protein QOF82_3384, partial [Frankiales bacterium]|nr:hypothetical protein [Frankiales bacterium]